MNLLHTLFKVSKLVLLLITIQLMMNCRASNTAKGTAIGAGSGAAIGGIIGHYAGNNTAIGAIIGATAGGATGAIIGRHMDKQAAELRSDLAGAEVERVGEGIKITFNSGLMFGFDSDELSSNTTSNLANLASTLNKYPDTDILIEGHTDKTGESSYNMTLSQRRSQSVAEYLKENQVKSSRITTKGYGEEQPVSDLDESNRRVEIAIYANRKMQRAAKNGKL